MGGDDRTTFRGICCTPRLSELGLTNFSVHRQRQVIRNTRPLPVKHTHSRLPIIHHEYAMSVKIIYRWKNGSTSKTDATVGEIGDSKNYYRLRHFSTSRDVRVTNGGSAPCAYFTSLVVLGGVNRTRSFADFSVNTSANDDARVYE